MSAPEPPPAPGVPPVVPGAAPVPGGGPLAEAAQAPRYSPGSLSAVAALRAELEGDIRRIEDENSEIDMLMEQVLAEIERHVARRTRMESQLATLEASAEPDHDQIGEIRTSLLALTRRELLFDAQRQVLEGKQRVLARFVQRLAEIDDSLASIGGLTVRGAPTASPGLRPLAMAAGNRVAPGAASPAEALRGQEDLRRDIVRQLHDGPAQSIANIGLQAEIVERLITKGDPRAAEEVEALRRLVQAALDTTKEFIFEIRPMVLDDLGLGPTIRRVASDRARRSGISVDFASQGVEERLDPDIESAVFRSVDEAIAGYLTLKPPSVVVRLDWSERELLATVTGTWPRVEPDDEPEAVAEADSRSGEMPPVLLAMMEEKRSADREARTASRSLAPERVAAISHRARALGLTLNFRDEGQTMQLVAPVAPSSRAPLTPA